MAFDFPSSPSIGQQYPSTPIAGVPVYIWDGQKWTRPVVTDVVRYDTAQSLTAAQQQQARQNIYAAPFDALAYSGMQINGGMEVSQELGINNARTSSGYVCDGWLLGFGGTMALSSAANNTAPYVPGIKGLIYVTVSTAQTSLGANDFTVINQRIEGYRVSRLAFATASASPITIGFWTNHHRPGVYSVVARNGAANRTYATTYTHAAADVVQYNVIIIPGDTTGTWATDNTLALDIIFTMAAGSSVTAPAANAWAAGAYLAAPSQVNGVAATSDAFRILGVTVLPGTQAPTAAQSANIMRPYDQELVTCQRYYQKYTNIIVAGYGQSAGSTVYSQFAVLPMRASPTVSLANPSYNNASGAVGTAVSTTNSLRLSVAITGTGHGYGQVDAILDARL